MPTKTLYDFDVDADRNTADFPENMQSRDLNDAFRRYMAQKAGFLEDTNGTAEASASSDGAGGRRFIATAAQNLDDAPTGLLLGFRPALGNDAPAKLTGPDGVSRFIVYPDGTHVASDGFTANETYWVVLRADGRYQLLSAPRGGVMPTRTAIAAGTVTLFSTDIGGVVAAQDSLPSDPLTFEITDELHAAWPIGTTLTFVVIDAQNVDVALPEGVSVIGSSTGPSEKVRRLYTAISRPAYGHLIKTASSEYRLVQLA